MDFCSHYYVFFAARARDLQPRQGSLPRLVAAVGDQQGPLGPIGDYWGLVGFIRVPRLVWVGPFWNIAELPVRGQMIQSFCYGWVDVFMSSWRNVMSARMEGARNAHDGSCEILGIPPVWV